MLSAQRLPHARIGVTDADSGEFEVQGLFTASLDELSEAWEGTLPRYFGSQVAAVVAEAGANPDEA